MKPSAELISLLGQLPLLKQWQEVRKQTGEQSRKAFVIEFAGMPKAGKSTAIENLRHFYTHGPKLLLAHDGQRKDLPPLGYRVHTPAEGVSLRTPNYLKRSPFDFNTWAGAYAVQELLQAAHDDHHDLVILDRGPWDAGCWLEYWTTAGDTGHSPKVKEFFQLPYWMTRSDLHVVLVVNPMEAVERERKHRLIQHRGASSNEQLMARMFEIYRTRFAELQRIKSQDCPHVGEDAALLIDSTTQSTDSVARQVIAASARVLKAKIDQHQSEFRFTPEWIAERLETYLPQTRARIKKKVPQFLSEFVVNGNELPSAKRQRLAELIEERAIRGSTLVELRVTEQTIRHELQKLLEEVSKS